jgi:transposase
MPRSRFLPTDEQRRLVKSLSAIGTKQNDVAQRLGITEKTLRKYFRQELDSGELEANSKVAQTLFKMATSGENTAATIFWLKTRAGWREGHHSVALPLAPAPFVVERGAA